ncbi:acyltransferase domain-containing protein [Streptomyces diastatochromogenes]|nr:acyltransferase domain-containing protein [Streptomyces diastatochromogenes]
MTGWTGPGGDTGCLAMFPGQGSQRPGMAGHLLDAHPSARRLFARADEILGLPLSQICVTGSAEELARTEITQPAIATTSLAVWELLRSAGYRRRRRRATAWASIRRWWPPGCCPWSRPCSWCGCAAG